MSKELDAKETLLWRLEFAYRNPHTEHLLMEAAAEIRRLQQHIELLKCCCPTCRKLLKIDKVID